MIFPLCLVLMLSASVLSESVRETETWMPMSTAQTVAVSTDGGDLEASGDSSNGSDFGFQDDDDDDEDDDEYYDYASGSGDGEVESDPRLKPGINDNRIPDVEPPVRPTVDEIDIVRNRNEIPLLGNELGTKEENPSNVLMSQAKGDSIFNKTEVLAAVIAGCAVCLMFAVLLILLLVYRMKKKDEGSYDLGKKPIYKKAPTTEIYA